MCNKICVYEGYLKNTDFLNILYTTRKICRFERNVLETVRIHIKFHIFYEQHNNNFIQLLLSLYNFVKVLQSFYFYLKFCSKL